MFSNYSESSVISARIVVKVFFPFFRIQQFILICSRESAIQNTAISVLICCRESAKRSDGHLLPYQLGIDNGMGKNSEYATLPPPEVS